jgi:hypothetical protein
VSDIHADDSIHLLFFDIQTLQSASMIYQLPVEGIQLNVPLKLAERHLKRTLVEQKIKK